MVIFLNVCYIWHVTVISRCCTFIITVFRACASRDIYVGTSYIIKVHWPHRVAVNKYLDPCFIFLLTLVTASKLYSTHLLEFTYFSFLNYYFWHWYVFEKSRLHSRRSFTLIIWSQPLVWLTHWKYESLKHTALNLSKGGVIEKWLVIFHSRTPDTVIVRLNKSAVDRRLFQSIIFFDVIEG